MASQRARARLACTNAPKEGRLRLLAPHAACACGMRGLSFAGGGLPATWAADGSRSMRAGEAPAVHVSAEADVRARVHRAGRILNVTVCPADTNEPPRLLNYMTAPHVSA